LGVGLHPYPVKKKIVEKPPRNSAGFCGGGQGLSWAVDPSKEEVSVYSIKINFIYSLYFFKYMSQRSCYMYES
jgi:hypothetical protein